MYVCQVFERAMNTSFIGSVCELSDDPCRQVG